MIQQERERVLEFIFPFYADVSFTPWSVWKNDENDNNSKVRSNDIY